MEEFFSHPFYWIRTNWLFSHLAEQTYQVLKSFFAGQQGAWPIRALKWYKELSKPLKREGVRRPSSASQGSLISQCLVG